MCFVMYSNLCAILFASFPIQVEIFMVLCIWVILDYNFDILNILL